MLAFVNHHLAIDDDELDADREPLGLGGGSGGLDALRIEYHEVSFKSIAQEASVGKPQPLGGERGHFADGIRQVHEAFFTYIFGENDREGAVGARTGVIADEDSIAADHGEGVAD